jgi:hypothetical protein
VNRTAGKRRGINRRRRNVSIRRIFGGGRSMGLLGVVAGLPLQTGF